MQLFVQIVGRQADLCDFKPIKYTSKLRFSRSFRIQKNLQDDLQKYVILKNNLYSTFWALWHRIDSGQIWPRPVKIGLKKESKVPKAAKVFKNYPKLLSYLIQYFPTLLPSSLSQSYDTVPWRRSLLKSIIYRIISCNKRNENDASVLLVIDN